MTAQEILDQLASDLVEGNLQRHYDLYTLQVSYDHMANVIAALDEVVRRISSQEYGFGQSEKILFPIEVFGPAWYLQLYKLADPSSRKLVLFTGGGSAEFCEELPAAQVAEFRAKEEAARRYQAAKERAERYQAKAVAAFEQAVRDQAKLSLEYVTPAEVAQLEAELAPIEELRDRMGQAHESWLGTQTWTAFGILEILGTSLPAPRVH